MRIALLALLAAGLLAVPAVADAPPKTKPKVRVTGTPPKKLKKTDLKRGTWTLARKGSFVAVRYVGVGWKSKKEFDSSWSSRSRSDLFTFEIGAGNVIEGWDRGVLGMRAGGRRRLDIPPGQAYGSDGTPDGSIRPGEALAFVVDLVKVCKTQHACDR